MPGRGVDDQAADDHALLAGSAGAVRRSTARSRAVACAAENGLTR